MGRADGSLDVLRAVVDEVGSAMTLAYLFFVVLVLLFIIYFVWSLYTRSKRGTRRL